MASIMASLAIIIAISAVVVCSNLTTENEISDKLSCGPYETSCPLGCCPYSHGFCCPDLLTCCPYGTSFCFMGLCFGLDKVNIFSRALEVRKPEKTVLKNPVVRTNEISDKLSCGPYETECLTGCCPLENGYCCPDLLTCCPHGTSFCLFGLCFGLDKDNSSYAFSRAAKIGTPEKIVPENPLSRRIEEVDGNFSCDPDETECPDGCCPLPDAVCCENDKCCPHDTICVLDKCLGFNKFNLTLYSSKSEKFRMTRKSISKCPSQWTECGTNCCPLPSAVCCSDNTHCCPEGYICNPTEGTCVKGKNFYHV